MLNKIKNYLINFLLAQLVVSLISLPILIFWGLPISKISFIGNLLFLPILIIFLVLSSIIFFTEILNIPNSIFIYFLNHISNFWDKLLNMGKKSWLIGFSKINIIFLLIIPILTFLILINKKVNTTIKKIVCLTSLLSIFIVSLKISNNFLKTKKIAFQNKLFITKTRDNFIKIKDLGFFAKKQSIEK
ncbi:hypothetical protein GF385_03545, partial [Candidatus Dependentiae bacterium]|nr:hypothetical protein [Candidatus Dependentiae bacterium]